jgi:uncharacterized delta-60 repeat protein
MRLRRWTVTAVSSIVMTGTALAGPAGAAPGDLDPTFGGNGIVTTDFAGAHDAAHALAIQTDGRIVVAGGTFSPAGSDFALARYGRDGSLDPTWGAGGRVTTDFDGRAEHAASIALQPDGKVVAAGGSSVAPNNADFALARYNANGSLDATFGAAGRVLTDYEAGNDAAFAVALQADGKIVAAGLSVTAGTGNLALARYNTDGSLDGTFDGDGRVSLDVAGGFDRAHAVAVQSDGRIVVAGMGWQGSQYHFVVARYLSSGALDPTFGFGGTVLTGFGGATNGANALAIQPDGRIVAAGSALGATGGEFALARYLANGAPDPSFDGDGILTTDVGGYHDTARALALQPDGRIVAAGDTRIVDVTSDVALARYNADGSRDTTFNGNGRVTADLSGYDDTAAALAIQGDGRIVAAGQAGFSSFDFALVRYDGKGPAAVAGAQGSSPRVRPCATPGGVDLNDLLGVPDQLVDRQCAEVAAGGQWRPVTTWIVNLSYDALPPDYVPAADRPIDDLAAKLLAVDVVIDRGTGRERTVVFSPAEALRTGITLAQLAPGNDPLPVAVTAPRVGPLSPGTHTAEVVWQLAATHCDGFGTSTTDNCLPAGPVSFGVRTFTVTTG